MKKWSITYPIFFCLDRYLHESFKSEFKDNWLICAHFIIIGKLLGSVMQKGSRVEGTHNTLAIPPKSFLKNNIMKKTFFIEEIEVV